ncbi:MAG TPA: lipoprotein [Pseudolabrys sp.]|nr:lipoprotein [Pseudolabrys sp.]
MSRFLDRPMLRMAAAGALIACLALAGCGRKGPLDPPPGAAVVDENEPPPRTGLVAPIMSPIGSAGKVSPDEPGIGPDGKPVASKGPRRPFVLDPLLN